MKNKKYLIKLAEILLLVLAIFSFIYSGKEIYRRSGEARERIMGIFVLK